MPDFTISKPFDRGVDTSGDVMSEVDQRDYYAHLGDGVINDITGAGLTVTTDGSTVVLLKPGLVKVQGIYAKLTADMSFNLSALGTQPTAGQSRIDVLVARLDMAAKKITGTLVTGTPGTSPARPAVTRTVGGTWDVPLRSWTYTGAGMTSTVDERVHLGPHLLARRAADLPADAYMGSTAHVGPKVYVRDFNAAGNPAWLLDENWGTATLTLPAGSTGGVSGLISHGLGVIPSFIGTDPIVDGTAHIMTAVDANDKTATTFRINLRRGDAAWTTTANLSVFWNAKR